ncbi:hypothetical protein BDQ17DRAFT_1234143 [Cyathus striatus]|nr:hypothetical protein BDQ17DRAFT_1234143 [Cyathus striatus]
MPFKHYSAYVLPFRFLKFLAIVVICILAFVSYVYLKNRPSYTLYNNFTDAEHADSLSEINNSHDGKKYVYFRQLQGAGFNNQAQEILLFHHLALMTSRVYVYQPFVWRPRGEKSLVPLSAFLRGPTNGAISSALFEEVCPEREIKHVNLRTTFDKQWEHALSALNGDDRCIMVDDWIFNWEYLASTGIHPIWPSFQKYLGNHFKWSKHVIDIVDRTQAKLGLRPKLSAPDAEPYIALHIRRGDFKGHCEYLARDRVGFTTWATLPLLQDSVLAPALDTGNITSVMEHCYPTLYRILDAVTVQAKRNPNVRRLHVLHDGAWDHPLVYLQYYKLVEALTNVGWAERNGWNGSMIKVTQTADVPIGWGEADWAVCVDVELGRRAQAFIGNGYSSLTTQVVALRLGDGGNASDITFV